MGTEFYIRFADAGWWRENSAEIERQIMSLPTFGAIHEGNIELLGLENRDKPGRWGFDIRLFKENEGYFVEVSARPASIGRDLTVFLTWLRNSTVIAVEDEDGAAMNCKLYE